MLMLMALAFVSVTSGCALFDRDASPRDKYIETQEAFTLVVGSVLDAKRAGLIEQEHYDDVVLPLIVEGSRLLDSMEIMFQQDKFDEVELLRQALLAIVLKLSAEGGD